MKVCGKCGQTKPAHDFHKNRSRSDGLQSYCKPCHSAASRQWVLTNPERTRERGREWERQNHDKVARSAKGWRSRNPDKPRAHKAVWRAVQAGQIERPDSCERCGRKCYPQGHHADYSKPLDVLWLCKSCHCALHAAIPAVGHGEHNPAGRGHGDQA